MSEFVIEKGVPVPRPKALAANPLRQIRTAKTGLANALRQMEIGDSIAFAHSLSINLHHQAARFGIRVLTRRDGDKMRFWRIA